MTTDIVQVELPHELVEEAQAFIRDGWAANLSELLADALRRYLHSHTKTVSDRVIQTWDELLALANEMAFERRYLFRGQSDSNWKLESSFHREFVNSTLRDDPDKALQLEAELLRVFRSVSHLYFDQSNLAPSASKLVCWSVMQHYGVPTRLLDWTDSFFVALYFAVADHSESDGALWALERKYLFELAPDDVNQGAITRLDSHGFDFELPLLQQPEKESQDGLVSATSIHDYRFFAFSPPLKTERAMSQSAWFTFSNHLLVEHDTAIELVNYKAADERIGLSKVIIRSSLKRDCLAKLKVMNITARTLFPGVDGMGRELKDQLRFRIFEDLVGG